MHGIALVFALCAQAGNGRRVKLVEEEHHVEKVATIDGPLKRQPGVSNGRSRLTLFALLYSSRAVHSHPRSEHITRPRVSDSRARLPWATVDSLSTARPVTRLHRPSMMTDTLTNEKSQSSEVSQVDAKTVDASSNFSSAIAPTNLSRGSAELLGYGKRLWKRMWRCLPSLKPTDGAPLAVVGLDGGAAFGGMLQNRWNVDELAKEALSTTATEPIIPQYYPARVWLWAQWRGTIVRRTLPREVFVACLVAFALVRLPGPESSTKLAQYLGGVARAWTLSATMASFMLSFFLSQSYALWRTAYSITRRVQGRLNDIGLLCSQFATRNSTTGCYTEEADELLANIARYVRLFHILFYASVTSKYASLRLPSGLQALVAENALTDEECELLTESAMGHNAVILWIGGLIDRGVADGRLGCGSARATGTSPIAVQMQLERSIIELRGTYVGLADQLSARMPLAYVQLVQILTDFLMFLTPFALVHSVGPVGCVLGTAVVTLFHSSIVTLAKLFLDPLNNEIEKRGGDPGIGGISVATLLTETNVGSERWRKSNAVVPDLVFRKRKEGEVAEEKSPNVIAGTGASATDYDKFQDDAGAMGDVTALAGSSPGYDLPDTA